MHLAKRGDILYIPVGASYSQKCESETLICFHLNIPGQVTSEIKLFSQADSNKICALFSNAEYLWRSRPENYEFMCMSVLYKILSEIRICEDFNPKVSTDLLQAALSYLNAHICDTALSLAHVCEKAHISRTYFNKLFREAYGRTPIVYINEQRIERAKQLLNSGGFSNEEIARLCGFNDVKYFYVVFKRLTGYTTKEYKKGYQTLKDNWFVSSK